MELTPNTEQKPAHSFSKIVLFLIIIGGFITTFFSGYFLGNHFLISENPTNPSNTSTVTPTIQPASALTPMPQDTTQFLPGKFYFDDTLIAITKDAPHIAIAISARRVEKESGYVQNTGVSFFDGSKWTRKLATNAISDLSLVSNNIITSWEVTMDPSRVLKESATGTIQIEDTNISFKTNQLQNEISMRSLPGYTKFMSQTSGRVVINGISHDAYMLYTKIYSLNAKDIQFYDEPLGLTTYWLAYWDNAGNFYHLDATSVDKPTAIYQTHQIGVLETNTSVTKTFTTSIKTNNTQQPSDFSIDFGNPIAQSLQIKRTTLINKAPNDKYTWFMGTVTGENLSNQEKGIGIIEYIHN